MNNIYKYSGFPFVKTNELQKKIIHKIMNLQKNNFYSEKNPCLCKQDNSIQISQRCRFGLNINFKLCKNCGVIRQDPIMTEVSTKEFYKNFYRKLYTGKDDDENKEEIFKSQYLSGEKYYYLIKSELLKKNYLLKNQKNILEIGSSCGGILKFFFDNKHNVYALDYDQEYIDFGKKKGITNVYNDINKIEKKFNLIILSHTLEHFKNLKQNIKLIEKILEEDGFIFLDLPGIFNFDYYHLRNLLYDYKRIHFLYHLQNAHNYYFIKETFTNFIINNTELEIIYIDEKINCILKKSKKKKVNKNLYDKKSYRKILSFIRLNHFRYFLLKNIRFVLIPINEIKKYFLKK